MEIQILHKQGKSLRAIARETDLAINTVRKYLNEGGKPQYVRTKPTEHKLDPYKDYIRERVKAAHPV